MFDEKLDETWLVEDTGPKRVLRDREKIPRTATAPPAPAPAPAPSLAALKPGGTMTPSGLPRIKLGSKVGGTSVDGLGLCVELPGWMVGPGTDVAD